MTYKGAYKMTNQTISLVEILEACPQLTEQAIVDLVNGLDVIDGAIVAQKSQDNSFTKQLFSLISGSKSRQQKLINEHVSQDLRIIKDYILNNEEKHQAHDLALTQISRGVGKIADKLKNHNAEIAELKQIQALTLSQFDLLEKILGQHEAWLLAQIEMDHLLAHWEADKLAIFSPEQALTAVCHRLYWGQFGTWLRLASHDSSFNQQAQKMLETLESKCLVILRQKTGRRDHQLVDRAYLSQQLCAQESLLNEAFELLSHGSNAPLLKLTHIVNEPDEHADFDENMPFVFSNTGLVTDAISFLKGDMQ